MSEEYHLLRRTVKLRQAGREVGWDLNMACWQGLELVGLLRAVVRRLWL